MLKNLISTAAVAAMLTLGHATGTMAQEQDHIRAYYTIDLQDPDSGVKWFTVRRGSLSWLKAESCQSESKLVANQHLATVRGFDLRNPAGKKPFVLLRGIECKKD